MMENNTPTPIPEQPQTPPTAPTSPVPPQSPYGQPMYQQPPYGQPGYPQPPYAPQPPREPLLKRLYGDADTLLSKLMMWVSVVLLLLVPVSLVVGFVGGVIAAASSYGVLSVFVSYVIDGIQWAAVYAFMGILLAFAKTRLDK